MKRTILSLIIFSSISTAHAMTIDQANRNVAIAEAEVSQAQANYNSSAYQKGAGVAGSVEEHDLNNASQRRAQAYADQRAAVQQHESEMEAATKADIQKEIDDRRAEARMNAPSATATPSIDRSQHLDNPNNAWSMTPGITKESNPAGNPTHQIAPATHLDGTHQAIPHATATATPSVDRSVHLDAPNHAIEAVTAQNKAIGDALAASNRQRTAIQHVAEANLNPVHKTATAKPDTADAAQGAQLTQMNIRRTAIEHVDANAVAEAEEQAAHAARYNMSIQPAVTITETAKVSVPVSALTPAIKPTTVTPPTTVPAQTLTPAVKHVETIGVKTPVEAVPATVVNVATAVVSVPFVDKKGGNGKTTSSHSDHGTGTGADNAHDHAFGGHTGGGGGFKY
ncbi:hypothetical protein M5Y49_21025 [Escherichia coli]|nr:hypothetical protein [Escherichia coli]